MKKIFILMLALSSGLPLFAQQELIYEAESFNAIHVQDAFKVYLTQADEYRVEVEAPTGMSDRIHVDVRNDVLDIRIKDKKGWKQTIAVTVYVYAPGVDEIHLSGASVLEFKNKMNLDDLELHLSGATSIKANSSCDDVTIHASGASNMELIMHADDIDMELSGSSMVTLSGSADDMNVRMSGATEINAEELKVENVSIDGSGSCYARLNLSGTLKAQLSGSSDIRYRCQSCDIDIQTSGSSLVKKY